MNIFKNSKRNTKEEIRQTQLSDFEKIRSEMKGIVAQIQDELNDHLESINANSGELQINYEYLSDVELKIDKLNEKIESIQMFLGMKKQEEAEKNKITLTLREQEIFLSLYTSEKLLSLEQIARKIGLTEASVKNYIDSIISKGVPIIKRYLGGNLQFVLDEEFRNLQAKENILEINEAIARQFS